MGTTILFLTLFFQLYSLDPPSHSILPPFSYTTHRSFLLLPVLRILWADKPSYKGDSESCRRRECDKKQQFLRAKGPSQLAGSDFFFSGRTPTEPANHFCLLRLPHRFMWRRLTCKCCLTQYGAIAITMSYFTSKQS